MCTVVKGIDRKGYRQKESPTPGTPVFYLKGEETQNTRRVQDLVFSVGVLLYLPEFQPVLVPLHLSDPLKPLGCRSDTPTL